MRRTFGIELYGVERNVVCGCLIVKLMSLIRLCSAPIPTQITHYLLHWSWQARTPDNTDSPDKTKAKENSFSVHYGTWKCHLKKRLSTWCWVECVMVWMAVCLLRLYDPLSFMNCVQTGATPEKRHILYQWKIREKLSRKVEFSDIVFTSRLQHKFQIFPFLKTPMVGKKYKCAWKDFPSFIRLSRFIIVHPWPEHLRYIPINLNKFHEDSNLFGR